MVKSMIEGIDPNTNEDISMAFEGNAVCVVSIKDVDGGVTADEAIVGSVNMDRAMALIKGLTSAVNHLLSELPPALSSIILADLFCEVMDKKDQAEMDAEAEDGGAENELA